jgi:antitoxin component of RelBE/YafQ-DinJ toxin-antitoxin module
MAVKQVFEGHGVDPDTAIYEAVKVLAREKGLTVNTRESSEPEYTGDSDNLFYFSTVEVLSSKPYFISGAVERQKDSWCATISDFEVVEAC